MKFEAGDLYFGITAAKSNLILQVDNCWLSSVYDEDDAMAGKIVDLILNGCGVANPSININVVGNYESSQARFNTDRMSLLGQLDTDKIYLQCEVNLCEETGAGACAAPSCPGKYVSRF